MTDKEMLDQAMNLVSRGDYSGGEQIFSQLLVAGLQHADSFYGLGVSRLNQNQLDVAQRQFDSCVRIDPAHSNALFYLGAIAESRGQMTEARTRYQQCLDANPQHLGALKKIGSPARTPMRFGLDPHNGDNSGNAAPVTSDRPLDDSRRNQSPPPETGRAKRGRGGDGRGDFYALLRDCDDRVECEMAAVLDQIATLVGKRKQRAIARLGFFPFLLMLVSGAILATAATGKADAAVLGAFALVTLCWMLALFFNFIAAKTSRIWCERDFLMISKGILSRKTKPYHLYLLSHSSPEKSQTLLNRITGDGSLILQGPTSMSGLRLRGYFRSAEIDTLASNFRTLSMLTPTNRDVLAAIGELKQIRAGMN